MDLTPYYVDLGRLGDATDEDLDRIGRSIIRNRQTVTEFIQSIGLSARLRPVDAQSKQPYILVTLDSATGSVGLDEFGPADLLDARRRESLRTKPRSGPAQHRLIYPVFPTVYSPAVANNQAQARNFAGHIHRALKRLDPADSDRILDVGTGSGYLTWIAWATARGMGRNPSMYAIDINPLAVANARSMARTAGFQLTTMVHDNVVDLGGNYAFPDTRFRFAIWDMPALPPVLKPYLSQRTDLNSPRRLMSYWDDGLGALESLERFAAALPGLLAPAPIPHPENAPRPEPSTVVVWNIVPVDMPDIVQETFHKTGMTTRLLDKYTSGHGAVTCVVYAVSLPDHQPRSAESR